MTKKMQEEETKRKETKRQRDKERKGWMETVDVDKGKRHSKQGRHEYWV